MKGELQIKTLCEGFQIIRDYYERLGNNNFQL